MRAPAVLTLVILTGVFRLVCCPSAFGEAVLTTASWENTDAAFAKCDREIRSLVPRNLLGRRGTLMFQDGRTTPEPVGELADGEAGQRGARGRVSMNGQPTVVTFYLGQPKTIDEIRVYSFNIDMRANQDYEVRWANGAGKPGEPPQFPKEPSLTTGPTVIGPDRGGFLTRYAGKQGPLVPEKADWIEFRFWRTYPVAAGSPGKDKTKANGAAHLVEVAVLGDKGDVAVPSADEVAVREAYAKLPPTPEYEKKNTWQETMVAARDKLRDWELVRDRMATYTGSAIFGDWHVLGPLEPKDPALKELREATAVDLAKTYPGKDGKTIGWQKRDDLVDGKIHDLAGHGGADEKGSIFLCRSVRLILPLDRSNDLPIEVHADNGSLQWLPKRQGHGVDRSFVMHKSGAEARELAGDCQLLMELKGSKEGPRRFYFQPQPNDGRTGAGRGSERLRRREQLAETVAAMFPDPASQAQIRWERNEGVWGFLPQSRSPEDWFSGHAEEFLAPRYRDAIGRRLADLRKNLDEQEGIRAMVATPIKPRIAEQLEKAQSAATPELGVAKLREILYRLGTLDDAIAMAAKARSMRLAVEDQQKTFGDRYPEGAKNLARVGEIEKESAAILDRVLGGDSGALAAVAEMSGRLEAAGQEILLANPVMEFDKLLLAFGNPSFNTNWGGPNRIGQKMVVLSPVRPDGQVTVIHDGQVSDMDLHWNADKVLFSDGSNLWEINIDGTGLRHVTPEGSQVAHYDACYLPSGRIACVSPACEQAVPCTGGAGVGNIHLMDADGANERRVTFDQDHDWNPTVLHDGRVLYTRWEYTDTPHYFSRLLFRMNPDGSGQMEYYGSNSYWPNAMYWPRPIPGHPTMVSCIVSGHHGVSRVGEFLLLDPARGRHEASGAVQKIPGYGKKVEAVTKDGLVVDVWPRFAAPYPLAEPGTNLGAGKYFLVSRMEHPWSTWDVCLADVFDNVIPILEGGYMTPIPVVRRPMPPVIPDRVDLTRKDAVVYLPDIYQGPGLKDFPRGSIKQLRVGSHHFRYAGNGDTRASSLEGGWDVKKILGAVPVNPDGSALFRVPANTPLFVQPLDQEGKAQQVMRSWFTAMPGEVLSCIGCHEKQNDVPPSQYNVAAMNRRPDEIEPWHGPPRGFSFDREVQPVLDRRCAGCHDGNTVAGTLRVPSATVDGEKLAVLDFRAKRFHDIPEPDSSAKKNKTSAESDYSPAYVALQRYVRRPGFEGDYHMPKPAEYEADTSMLVQMLKKGHHNVRLTPEEWQRLYAWIDYNVPYPINWRESHRPPRDEQVELRAKYKALYANVDDHDEDPAPLPPVAKFEPPQPEAAPAAPLKLDGWPFSAEQAAAMQTSGGPVQKTLDLGDGVTMAFVRIPAGKFVLGDPLGYPDEQPQAAVAIDQPFYMGQFEVTNGQYARFDPLHNSGVINERWKDRSRRGTPIDAPEMPVVRINWHRAIAFCRWLSEKTGQRCTLPTEAQWEWACRAGTATPLYVGAYSQGMPAFSNIADEGLRGWNHGRAETGYNDGSQFTAAGDRYPPNPWGLYHMHGNVAEWCLTAYKPYPYNAADGRNDPASPGPKVVRGGSWNDLMRFATSASRWRYEPYKPVYNVGFRVVFPAARGDVVATREAVVPSQ